MVLTTLLELLELEPVVLTTRLELELVEPMPAVTWLVETLHSWTGCCIGTSYVRSLAPFSASRTAICHVICIQPLCSSGFSC